MIGQLTLPDVLFESAAEIFETMVFMDIEKATDQESMVDGDSLLGSITFKGDLEGCVSICCNMQCAKTIAANMLGLDNPQELSEEEICDAIGEITNMIMGSVKARLIETVGDLEVSIPSVVSGRHLESSLGEKTEHTSLMVNVSQEHTAELCMFYRKVS